MLQILNQSGELVGDKPDLDDASLVEMYRHMVLARTLDTKLANMNLQGRTASYYKIAGQEAHVGAAFAMGDNDWLYPAYREMGMWLAQGLPMETVVKLWIGTADYNWDSDKHRIAMLCATIGTQIPHGAGHAYAAKQQGTGQVVVTVMGDGATSTPDFHAALNFAGVWKAPAVFLVQNNQWAEETPLAQQTASETIAQKAEAYGFEGIRVDGQDALAVYEAMKKAVDKARSGDGPTLVEMLTYRYSPHMVSAVDPRPQEERDYWYSQDPVDRMANFLRNEGLTDDAAMDKIASEASVQVESTVDKIDQEEASEGIPGIDYMIRNAYERIPTTLLEQAETWARWSGKPAPSVQPDEIWQLQEDDIPKGGETNNWCMREALNAAIDQAMAARDNTVILGEDVALVGGEFRVTENMMDKYGKDRVIDTPLCEIGIIGTAVGMASAGLRPIAEIMFAGFTYTALDNIIGHVGRWRYRYNARKSMPMVIRMGHGSGVAGHEFHIDSPESYFLHSPGLAVVYPSTPLEAKGLMAAALEGDDPVIFFEPMLMYNAPREEVPVEHFTIPIGKASIKQAGTDVTLVTYGNMVPAALQAAKQSGASVEVIDLRTIKPWDQETVLKSVEKTGRLVVVAEPSRSAGVGADIVATVANKGIYSLDAPPVQVTGLDAPRPIRKLEQLALIKAGQIKAAIQDVLKG